MSTRLVILGILRQGPLHGYELKRIIEERMGDWTRIAFGSIYFALGKMAEEGWIEKIATEQQGGRPSRSVYQITEAGHTEFLRLLRETWQEEQRIYHAVDMAVFFMDALPLDEVKTYLRRRETALAAAVSYVTEQRDEHREQSQVPRVTFPIFDHGINYLVMELQWTQALLAQIERGDLP